jgi:hypothetical protein
MQHIQLVIGGITYNYQLVETKADEPFQLLECDDSDVAVEEEIENLLDKDKSYHKMDTILKEIETGERTREKHLSDLKLYIAAAHPNIKVARTSSIVSLTDKLLEEAYRSATLRQLKDTMPTIRAILNAQTPNVNYLSKRFQALRKILKERFGEKSAIYKLHYKSGGLTHEQHVDKEKQGKLNRDNRLANRTQIGENQAREILNKTSASPDVYDNILALQLATGARFIEAVRVSSFKRVPYSKNVVKVVGIAKRGEEGKHVDIDRPIFGMDIDELLELQNHVRRELKQMYPGIDKLTNDQVDKLLLTNVNRRVKALAAADESNGDMSPLVGIDSSHIMRKLYANMTHFELPDVNKAAMDKHHHIRTVLGHKNVETSASYANVKIKKSVNISNHRDIEQKFAEVDRTDARQDKQLAELKQETTELKADVPKAGRSLTVAAPGIVRTVELLNLRGQRVKIEAKIPPMRGNAQIRCLDIMNQLGDNLVLISEEILKKSFGFGSNTITKLAKEKRAINEDTFAKVYPAQKNT